MIPPPPANAGFLGVALDEAEGGARVANIVPNSAADKAGLQVNDIVTLVADTAIIDSETMVNAIRHHKPGDALPIKVKRDGKEIDLRATLGKRPPDPGLARREYQNHLGSELSERRSGFPQVLQHDMVLQPDNCGGPVVDLDGKAIGINIARAGRVETYAIPAEAVRALIDELKSGKLTAANTTPTTRTTASTTKPAAVTTMRAAPACSSGTLCLPSGRVTRRWFGSICVTLDAGPASRLNKLVARETRPDWLAWEQRELLRLSSQPPADAPRDPPTGG